jgi:Flp pilus assembly protein TadD
MAHANSYMYLAIALSQLGDVDNACLSYEKAIKLADTPGEPVFHLNYGAVSMSIVCE